MDCNNQNSTDTVVTNSNLEFRKIPFLKYLYEINSNGTIFRNVKSKKQSKIILDYHHSEKGYYTTWVRIGGRKPDAKTIRVPIAKAVAACWLGERPEGYEIDHIDRNPHNNDYRNLRYVTKSQQMQNRDHTLISYIGLQNLKKQQRAVSQAVKLLKDDVERYFESMTQAAYFLSEEYGTTSEHMRSKLKKRRSHIKDYDVIYLNAETASNRSTEQGTVQT